jgi:hypothetical protein
MSTDLVGGRRLAESIDPILGSLLDMAGNPLRLVLRPGWVSTAHGALGVNSSRRIDGMMADRAAFPTGIEGWRVVVVVPWIHRDTPVAVRACRREPRPVGPEGLREAEGSGAPPRDLGIENKGLSVSSVVPQAGCPASPSHESHGISRHARK